METYPTNNEAELKFLHPAGPSSSFKFPNRDDILIVSHTDILMTVNSKIPTGHVYKLSSADIEASDLLGLK